MGALSQPERSVYGNLWSVDSVPDGALLNGATGSGLVGRIRRRAPSSGRKTGTGITHRESLPNSAQSAQILTQAVCVVGVGFFCRETAKSSRPASDNDALRRQTSITVSNWRRSKRSSSRSSSEGDEDTCQLPCKTAISSSTRANVMRPCSARVAIRATDELSSRKLPRQ